MSLELFIGPMFAGKSSEVLRILQRNNVIGRKTLVITHAIDTRYSENPLIVTHNQHSHPACAVHTLMPLLQSNELHTADCVIIEEAQFFPDLKDFVLKVVEEHGRHVICVGLDGDSERRPFGQLLDLIPYCDTVTKFKALCKRCGDGTEAIFTYRLRGAPTAQINVGGADQYEALCRGHFIRATIGLD